MSSPATCSPHCPAGRHTAPASYADAIERGAVAVLTDAAGLAQLNRDAGSVPVLVHPEPRSVLGELAATVYGRPSEHLAVVGITGTSGKTTTTYLIEAGLRSAGRTVGLIGTVGLRINGVDIPSALTTPEAPALQALLAVMAERGVDTVVMEVSSHALTLGRVDGIHFAVGGFTNLSRDHLDFHPTMEDYFEAKARLFDPASPLHARRAVVCVDDDAGRSMAHRADKVIDGQHEGSARGLARRSHHGRGRRAGVHRGRPGRCAPPDRESRCLATTTSPIALSHWRFSTPSGFPPSRRQLGLRHTQVPGRLERIDRGQNFLALVDYAHKPGALQEVLRTLRRPDRPAGGGVRRRRRSRSG